MKGRAFILNKDVVDGKPRVPARCGARVLWVHPDLVERLDNGELEGYDESGHLQTWSRVPNDDNVVTMERDDEQSVQQQQSAEVLVPRDTDTTDAGNGDGEESDGEDSEDEFRGLDQDN